MDQRKFIEDLPYAQGGDKKAPRDTVLGKATHREYRSGTGGVGWTAKTRADMLVDVSLLQGEAAAPTQGDLIDLNCCIRQLKDSKDVKLHYHALPGSEKWRILVLADASFNSRTDLKKRTHYGFFALLATDRADTEDGPVHILTFISKRATRVTKSTLTSEAVA